MNQTVVIIGAGPAGLTAAYNLLNNTLKKPEVYIIEATNSVGGISKTINCSGFSYDLGGHRYLSSNPRIIELWRSIIGEDLLSVARSSKILYDGKLIDYPIKLDLSIIKSVGIINFLKVLSSYILSKLSQRKEITLEDLFINRFGTTLYSLFFDAYTEKVWGRQANLIPSEWGRQRIGNVSILQLLYNLFGMQQSEMSTSRCFYYPKHGSGQLWNSMAERINLLGGHIILNDPVQLIEIKEHKAVNIICRSGRRYVPDHIISSMPVRELFDCFQKVPYKVKKISSSLPYRNIIVVGLVLPIVSIQRNSFLFSGKDITQDQWIYVQDKEIIAGRIQIFNNWSSELCREKDSICVGLEYFCDEGSSIWIKDKANLINIVVNDLIKLKIISHGTRIEKIEYTKISNAYPCYWDGYEHFDKLIQYLNQSIKNLYLVGRNGLHQYYNIDKAMETALTVSDNLNHCLLN